MKKTYNVVLELSDTEFNNLQSFVEFNKAEEVDIYYRYATLEKVVKAIFSAREYEQLKLKVHGSTDRCKCGHSNEYHSLLGDRVCSRESCACLKYIKAVS